MNEQLCFENVMKISGTGAGPITHTDCRKYLRHTHPMLSLDRVVDHDFTKGWVHSARAISCSDPVFEGHFPDAAVYPGTHLNQDINQIGILLFIGMTGPLIIEGNNQEMTAVSSLKCSFGHPVPPGCLLDMAVWATGLKSRQRIDLRFEGRVKNFRYYTVENKYGLKFGAAVRGEATLIRGKRKIYDGIWL